MFGFCGSGCEAPQPPLRLAAPYRIYGFRGSKADMLGRIAAHWGCRAFELATNYRCAEPIVAA